VAEALESDMSVHLATRQDLLLLRKDVDVLRKDMDAGFALLKAEFKQDLTQQTVRLGIMMVGALTLLFAALKLVP